MGKEKQTPGAPSPDESSSIDQIVKARDGRPEWHDVSALHAAIMREKLDPKDGYEPVPLWLVAVFGALVFWGGWYLATYSGGFRSDILDENPEARYAGLGGAEAARPVDPVVLGKRLYTANCISCHQASGAGVAGQYPPLAGSEWVVGEPARLKRILLHGLSGPVSVKGATYVGNMPPFGQKMKDEQIAAVLTYVRSNGEWGNTAGAIGAESVGATRAVTATRSEPWTAAELMAVTKDEVGVAPATSAPATGAAAGGPTTRGAGR